MYAQNRAEKITNLMPQLGGPHRNIVIAFGTVKTRMVWLRNGLKKCEDTFRCFNRIPASDRKTAQSALCIA